MLFSRNITKHLVIYNIQCNYDSGQPYGCVISMEASGDLFNQISSLLHTLIYSNGVATPEDWNLF